MESIWGYNHEDFSILFMLHDTAEWFQGQTRSPFANNSHDIFETLHSLFTYLVSSGWKLNIELLQLLHLKTVL